MYVKKVMRRVTDESDYGFMLTNGEKTNKKLNIYHYVLYFYIRGGKLKESAVVLSCCHEYEAAEEKFSLRSC